MDELKQQARTAFLDEVSDGTSRHSETTTLPVGEQEVEVEIRALPIAEYESTKLPDVVRDADGGVVDEYEDMQYSTLRGVALLQRCAYVPGTDERIFSEPEDARQILDQPFDASGWLPRLIGLVKYVHGQRSEPPPGVTEPKLAEIAQAAEDLETIAASKEDLDASKVETIAGRIKSFARLLDNGTAEDPEAGEGK